MIIVSDTTPLHYLILIGKDEVLPTLFDEIIVPEAVLAELSHERTPDVVLRWISKLPPWIEVRSAPSILAAEVSGLGKG